MVLIGAAIALAVIVLGLWLAARSAITVCVAEVKDGKLEVISGGVAPRVLADLREVVLRAHVPYARLRIVKDRGRAKVEVRGKLSEDDRQRIRNVVGSVPLAKLVNARSKKKN